MDAMIGMYLSMYWTSSEDVGLLPCKCRDTVLHIMIEALRVMKVVFVVKILEVVEDDLVIRNTF